MHSRLAPYAADLHLALECADQVDALTLPRFQANDLRIDTKPDCTPVSDADRSAEKLLRTHISAARPEDSIKGEEYGVSGSGLRQWIIDPIDGTKNFIRGVPIWATLIALVENGQAVVGVVSAPALGRRWWAAQSAGAFTSDAYSSVPRHLQVSQVSRLEDASMSLASLEGWKERRLLPQIWQLSADVWRFRAYGDFLSHMLVAEGAVDFAAEPELADYDMAALVPIVEEAGGKFTGLDGRQGHHSGNGISSNGTLHDVLLHRFQVPLR